MTKADPGLEKDVKSTSGSLSDTSVALLLRGGVACFGLLLELVEPIARFQKENILHGYISNTALPAAVLLL